MDTARKVTPEIDILPSHLPVPGLGFIPINAYVLKAAQPVLVDTGAVIESNDFIAALESVIDPEEIKWIWLTHPDQDHVGSLRTLIDRVPGARVVTTYLGLGIMSLFSPLPLDRVFLLNPGEKIDIGDRELVCLKPPAFDSPATTELYDSKSRVLFSSDFFGAVLQTPAEEAYAIPAAELKEAQMTWSRVDAPWLHKVDTTKFAAELNKIREIDPAIVLSSHLPPARAMLPQMLQALSEVPGSEPLVLPNQAQLEAMIAQMTHGAPVPA